MPRTVPLIAGLVVVSAVTYKFREDLLKDTGDLQSRLVSARSRLDQITSAESTQQLGSQTTMNSILPDINPIQDSKTYINDRLVPSVKHTWNDHVTELAHTLIKTDYAGKAKQAWDKVKDNVQ